MKKTILIIAHNKIDADDISKGVGGSETWVIEISKAIQNTGKYQCVVCTYSDIFYKIYQNGMIYINYAYLQRFLKHANVDYCVINRYMYSEVLNILKQYIDTTNMVWIAHDVDITIDNKSLTYEMIQNDEFISKNLKSIICMSDFGVKVLMNKNIPDSYFKILGNGINFSYIKDEKHTYRDNNILWSSRYERGLELLANNIFPIYQQKFPDAKIYVAQYEDYLPDNLKNNANIVFLGKLNKEDLYNEMQKHKIAFYPNFFPETFCITVLENILCGNELIMSFKHGPQTTLKIFENDFINENLDLTDSNTYNYVAELLIERNINYYEQSRINFRNCMINYIKDNYSWEVITKKFLEIINNYD